MPEILTPGAGPTMLRFVLKLIGPLVSVMVRNAVPKNAGSNEMSVGELVSAARSDPGPESASFVISAVKSASNAPISTTPRMRGFPSMSINGGGP